MYKKARFLKYFILRAGSAIFILLCVFSFSIPDSQALTADELKNQIEQKARELGEVNQKISETQSVLSTVAAKGKTLSQEVVRIDSSIKQTDLSIKASAINIEKLGLEINSLEGDIQTKEQQITAKREAISSLLQDYQIKDTEGLLLMLFKHPSLAAGLAETQSIVNLNDRLLQDLGEIRNLKAELGQRLDSVTEKQQDVKQEQNNLKAKKSVAEDQKQERQELLAQTKNQEKEYQSILSELEKQQQAIGAEIDEIEAQLRANFDIGLLPTKRPGALGYPVANARMTQTYGATAFAQRAYKSKFHNGIDFAASIGTPIYAAEDGKVTATGDNGRIQYGRFILITHENGLSTLYAHLSRFAVTSGSTVKRGELIGYSGNTGYSTGPHLHFTVYWATSVQMKPFPGAGLVPVGTTVSPLDYL